MDKGRIIIVDVGIMTHRCIFAQGAMQRMINEGKLSQDTAILPIEYGYFLSLLAILKKIVVKKNDKVVMACDARHSWRRAFYIPYKGNRTALREGHTEINWEEQYAKIEAINQQLNESTDWHFIKISDFITFEDICETKQGQELNIDQYEIDPDQTYGIESDDIQAVASKLYENQEVILVTGDADLDQLTYNKNTKIFSTNVKYKNQKGCYKIVPNALKVVADKSRKGDISDNITVSENDTERDYKIRQLIVDLLTLPEFVKEPIENILSNLPDKNIDFDILPFKNSLGHPDNFSKIYLPDKEITWEKALIENEKTLLKKKIKTKETYAKNKVKKDKAKAEAFR